MTTAFWAQLPEEAQRMLRTVSPLGWDGIDVQVQRLSHLEASVPQSKVWTGLRYVVGAMRGNRRIRGALRVVGATINQTIFIDPDFADWNTASGLALLAHERVHVEQQRTVPNFDELYAEAQAFVRPNHPEDNPYEMFAYQTECSVFHRLVAEGVPPGKWTPLGVAMGFCSG